MENPFLNTALNTVNPTSAALSVNLGYFDGVQEVLPARRVTMRVPNRSTYVSRSRPGRASSTPIRHGGRAVSYTHLTLPTMAVV